MLALNKWGPSAWHFLHAIMMTSPRTLDARQRADMRSFLRLVGVHLPCPRCREHYARFMERELTEERLATRERLVELMNDCHNDVNRRTQKREFTLREHYEWMQSGRATPASAGDLPLRAAVAVASIVLLHALVRRCRRGDRRPGAAAQVW